MYCVKGDKISTVVVLLEGLANLIFNCCNDNQMKGNEGSADETMQVKIGAAFINDSKCEKILGVKISSKERRSIMIAFSNHSSTVVLS